MNLKKLILATAAASIAGTFGLANAQSGGYFVYEKAEGPSRYSPSGNSLREDPRMQNPGDPLAMWPRFIPVAEVAPVEKIVYVDRPVEKIVEVEKPTGAVAVTPPRPARVDRN